MKKSELKEMIRQAMLAETTIEEFSVYEAEGDEFETAKPARITSFLKALDLLVYDEYHSELYDSDEVKQAYDLLVKAAKKLIQTT